jgi:type II secretory pathway component PulF
MTLWQYTAIESDSTSPSAKRRGELAADSATEVRASLRQIGLQVIDIRPLRPSLLTQLQAFSPIEQMPDVLARHLRARRRLDRAELYDSLTTLLDSGVPLLEAINTLARSSGRKRSMRTMLLQIHEALRGGGSLNSAMGEHAGWFDAVEVAMVQAGQHGGTLPAVLRSLAERQERSSALMHKLIGALAYPAIITLVGLGVVIFLSINTLPSLVQLLRDAEIEAPTLTLHVMAIGQFIAGHWLLIMLSGLFAAIGGIVLAEIAKCRAPLPQTLRLDRESTSGGPRWIGLGRLRPRVMRRMAVASVATQLAALVRSGVPLVDAMRVIAPTAFGGSHRGLRGCLLEAGRRLERGDDVAAALDDELYFDAEFRRLLHIGETSGELDELLERLGQRYERRAARQIDRLATLLEPVVILGLAALVGTIVMAAILPLLRLKEVL